MPKTRTALSLGFLMAGAAASNAGEPSRTLMHKLHAHRAAHHRTVDLRAHEGAPVIGSELKMGVRLGATSMVPETDVAAPMGANEGCLWGLNRYNGVSCPWALDRRSIRCRRDRSRPLEPSASRKVQFRGTAPKTSHSPRADRYPRS
jgi:hypothetical protein